MSDAIDALSKAMQLNKRLAASKLVRKQELEAELERLRAAGADETAALAELAQTERELAAAKAEIAELGRLAAQSRGPAAVAALMADDPVLRSPEEAALDRAREHIRETAALVDLGDEEHSDDATLPAGSAAAPKLPTPTPMPTREQADADARAKFEELRKKREEDALVVSGKIPPKKTL
jgi:hypothetical protein